MTELVQNINNLIDRMHNDPDWTDYVQLVTDAIENCAVHMNLVAREEALLQSARIRLSEAKFKDFQLRLNETRQLRYDAVIHYINLLNKLAKTNKLPPMSMRLARKPISGLPGRWSMSIAPPVLSVVCPNPKQKAKIIFTKKGDESHSVRSGSTSIRNGSMKPKKKHIKSSCVSLRIP